MESRGRARYLLGVVLSRIKKQADMIEEHDFLKFGPIQIETFAPLHPVVEAFAGKHGLRLSRAFDGGDMVCPHSCYFLALNDEMFRHCFIRICAVELFEVGERFTIGAQSKPWRHYKQWKYGVAEGPGRLENILTEAYHFIRATVEPVDGTDSDEVL
jgi:hypothetical protein